MIGRLNNEENNPNVISVQSKHVSRRHCEILVQENGIITLEDFSSYGTYLNSELTHKATREIRVNDKLALGFALPKQDVDNLDPDFVLFKIELFKPLVKQEMKQEEQGEEEEDEEQELVIDEHFEQLLANIPQNPEPSIVPIAELPSLVDNVKSEMIKLHEMKSHDITIDLCDDDDDDSPEPVIKTEMIEPYNTQQLLNELESQTQVLEEVVVLEEENEQEDPLDKMLEDLSGTQILEKIEKLPQVEKIKIASALANIIPIDDTIKNEKNRTIKRKKKKKRLLSSSSSEEDMTYKCTKNVYVSLKSLSQEEVLRYTSSDELSTTAAVEKKSKTFNRKSDSQLLKEISGKKTTPEDVATIKHILPQKVPAARRNSIDNNFTVRAYGSNKPTQMVKPTFVDPPPRPVISAIKAIEPVYKNQILQQAGPRKREARITPEQRENVVKKRQRLQHPPCLTPQDLKNVIFKIPKRPPLPRAKVELQENKKNI